MPVNCLVHVNDAAYVKGIFLTDRNNWNYVFLTPINAVRLLWVFRKSQNNHSNLDTLSCYVFAVVETKLSADRHFQTRFWTKTSNWTLAEDKAVTTRVASRLLPSKEGMSHQCTLRACVRARARARVCVYFAPCQTILHNNWS
jgi:hypothetical protein